MKRIFITALLLGALTVQAQYKTAEYTDEFGDPTGKTFLSQQCTGVFSNSAATAARCGFMLQLDTAESIMAIVIYPYDGATPERFVKAQFGEIKLKTPSGEKVVVSCFVSTKGTIFFSDERYSKWMAATAAQGEYQAVFSYVSKYSSKSYSFKFTV